jgi:hypothetical protein
MNLKLELNHCWGRTIIMISKLKFYKSVEKNLVPMRIAMSLLSDWVSLPKKAAMNILLGKSSLFRKCPDGLAFQHSGKFSIFFDRSSHSGRE